jgi:hypothetical protein
MPFSGTVTKVVRSRLAEASLFYRYIRRRFFCIVTEDDEAFVQEFMHKIRIASAIACVIGLLFSAILPSPYNGLGNAILFWGIVCLIASVVTKVQDGESENEPNPPQR